MAATALHASAVGLLLVPFLCACGGSSADVPPPGEGGGEESPAFVLVEHPFPRKAAWFGETVAATDLDGDGDLDLVIGATGEGVVYLAFREGGVGSPRWEVTAALGPEGPVPLPVPKLSDHRFGAALAVGELDGDPQPELLVGAPARDGGEGAAFVFGVDGPLFAEPLVVTAPAGGQFGTGMAIGDLDGDQVADLCVSALRAQVPGVPGVPAGSLWFYAGPIESPLEPTLELPNPTPVENGAYGLHLSISQAPSEPTPSLHVAAPGNTNSVGVPKAGQVLVYPAPLDPEAWLVAEEPVGDLFDLPRFGMHVATREGFLAIGAPRKDLGNIEDAGLGFVFDPGLVRATLHGGEDPSAQDLLGFRVGVGDVTGGDELDFVFVALQPREVRIWDGTDRSGEPQVLHALPDAGDHFGMGLCLADVLGSGREEVVLGDPTWDRPGENLHDDVGRVVVQRHRWK